MRAGTWIAAAALIGLAAPAGAEVRLHFGYSPFVPGYYLYEPRPYFRPIPRPRYRYIEPPFDEPPGYAERRYEPDEFQTEEPGEEAPAAVPKPKAKPQKPKPTLISCAKATKIVADYGFSSVKSTNCKGVIYSFSAQRDGKSFTVKLSARDGELTEVKKL